MRKCIRTRGWIVVTAVTCALACVAAAGAMGTRSDAVFTLAEIRGLMAQYHPNALLPTRVPPRVAFVDVGGGCSSLGVGGPPCFAHLEYHVRRTGGVSAFQLAIYDGRVASKVVRALLRHDGKFGSTTSLHRRALRWDKGAPVGQAVQGRRRGCVRLAIQDDDLRAHRPLPGQRSAVLPRHRPANDHRIVFSSSLSIGSLGMGVEDRPTLVRQRAEEIDVRAKRLVAADVAALAL